MLLVAILFLAGVVPFNADIIGKFLIGALLLVLGQTIFLIAIDGSIIKVGKIVGSAIMKKKSVLLIVLFGFLFGLVTTLAEPDVQVLVGEIVNLNPFLSSWLLLSICGIGCGLFVCFGLMRIVKNISLKWLLLALYSIVIVLACFVPNSFIGFAFDMGGVSTGSVTVPFILALAVGICAIRGKSRATDTFGVIAISSIGPILAILILGLVIGPVETGVQAHTFMGFGDAILTCMRDVCLAFLPLLIIFLVANFLMLKLSLKQVCNIIIGFLISALGLVLFLTGINFGFSQMGYFIGQTIAFGTTNVMIILFGLALGLLFVFTDPSIVVVVGQVEEITSGLLRKSVVFITLGIGIATAVALALVHVIFEVNLLFIVLPLLILALLLNFVVPKMFGALAFDCGGISSGTMSVAFVLPMCLGLCGALNLETTGFGIVGIIATVPILTMQVLGVIYAIKHKNLERRRKLEQN